MKTDIDKLKQSEDLALFLGMFAGDGCLSISRNGSGARIYPIRFYNTKKSYVYLFRSLFLRLFSVRGSVRGRVRKGKRVLWEFEKYSVELYRIINEHFEISNGRKALSVEIPSFIQHGTEAIKKNFFLGLLITDGSVKKDGSIMFHSASLNLILGLKYLIEDVWGFDRSVKSYIQQERYLSHQLTLNKSQTFRVLSELPASHNLVLRRFLTSKIKERKP